MSKYKLIMVQTAKIAIVSYNSTLTKAQGLASRLHLPLTDHYTQDNYRFFLAVTPEHLELRENSIKNSKPIFVDFLASKLNYRIKHGGGKKQLLAKAIGIKKEPLSVIDATAGFGIDGFILASLGCEVLMLERSPLVGALLEDGLENFKKRQGSPTIKLDLQTVQAADYLRSIDGDNIKKPDVIYLDPMYPKREKMVLNKKAMRILHELVGEDRDAADLLPLALKCAKKRVVVKRPKYAAPLNELKSDLQFSSGGSCRYDVYFP